MPNIVPITPPRVPLIDPRTGLIDRAWYLFFLSLNNIATGVIDNPDVGPSPQALIASYDQALQLLAQNVDTQPPIIQMAGDITPIDDQSALLTAQISEFQKQIDALNLLPMQPPQNITSGTSILYGNGLGGFSNVTIGSGVSFSSGTLSATGSGGTVTSVSVTTANGFAGTVATATTTPAITLTTSITGLLYGNGTAISAAVANTDYVPLSTVLTKTADYTITGTDTWIINNKSGSAMTLTFPAASAWTGRSITVKNMQAQAVNSASSNIVPIDSTTAGTAILLGVVGNWATMVSDGTNWVIMQAASNNNLLLE
jgi:hypothetical protein